MLAVMTVTRTIEVDEATAVALEASAAEQGVSVAELLAELALTLLATPPAQACAEDWSEDLARFAEYERTGISYDMDECLAEFHAKLDQALAAKSSLKGRPTD